MKNISLLLLLVFISSSIYSQNKYAYFYMDDSIGNRSEGVVLDNGVEIIPAVHLNIFLMGNYFFCKNEKGYGIYSKTGILEIDHQFEDVSYGFSSDLLGVKKDEFWGFINTKGETVIPFEYEKACNFYDGKAYVFQNGQAFYINLRNEVVDIADRIVEHCDEAVDTALAWFDQFEFDDSLKTKELDGKFGVVNTRGEAVIPIFYDEIGDYDNDIIFVRKGKLWGAYTNKGKLLIAPKYHEMSWFLDW